MFRVKATQSGPIFNGQADAALAAFIEDAEREVGQMGVDVVRGELNVVLKNQTGHYRNSVEAIHRGGDVVITGEKVIYGWWLEGVGSRNSPVTRFKGYATFRRMRQVVQARAHEVAERVLQKYIGRMG